MATVDRRSFLRNSAALGVAAIAGCSTARNSRTDRLPAAVATPRRGPNEEIRVAVVGFHSRGQEHINAHARVPHVRVVTLCDVDTRLFDKGIKQVVQSGGPVPKTEFEFRRVLDDPEIDVVSIATPNHWHSLQAIWACQAGKDVYVEKPCSHNIFEGRQLVAAARKYNRIVQHGTQARSSAALREAMQLLRDGVIGDIYMARALCYKRRDSIGIQEDQPHPPEGVHYDLWLGPAPVRPFNANRFHYNWHWNWDYGNGDIGNQGVHQMDIARWGMNQTLPVRVSSMGGRYTYQDQGQTPNSQVATFQYADGKMLVFEVRGRQSNDEAGVGIDNLFYGSKGYMSVQGCDGPYETVIDGKPGPKGGAGGDHFANFHAAVRSRNVADLHAPIEEGHYSSALCHLANIAYRLGDTLEFNPKTERFVGNRQADTMLTRAYREPYAARSV